MSGARFLIVNADDFGLSDGVNDGIVRAHEQGIVTTASLMVRQPAAGAAAEYARGRPRLGVGLHLDFGEWVHGDGEWKPLYQVIDAEDADEVEREAIRQLEHFRLLLGRDPTHLDSHQHAHRSEPALSVARRLAEDLAVPLRHFSPSVRYCGDFYGQGNKGCPMPEAITAKALVRVIGSLPPGVTEMACHPGLDPRLASPYRDERLAEVEALCDASVRLAVTEAHVRLISFAALQSLP